MIVQRLKFAVLSLVSILLFLWFAALGFGGIAAFLSEPALQALTIVTILLTVAAMFTRGNLSSGEREDRGNRWVLWTFAVIGILLAFVPAYTDRTDFWTFGDDGVRWLGVAVYTIGGILRLWPVFVLGHRFSGLVAIQEGHTLVTTGLYRRIRNPSYLGLVVNSVGWALAFRSGVGLVLAALTLVPLVGRMNAEESLLESQFGDAYRAYRAHSWRLLPGIY